VETPGLRYDNGSTFEMWPSAQGAHSWLPMSFSPKTKLTYIPTIEFPLTYSDKGIDLQNWHRVPGAAVDEGVNIGLVKRPDAVGTSFLLAWDPVRQKAAWRVPTPGLWNGGTMATGGNLVFQGQIDRKFNAYAAGSGELVWTFEAGASVIAPPITYLVKGQQYVTVLTGMGTSGNIMGALQTQFHIDVRTEQKRVLTFALGGKGVLPPAIIRPLIAPEDPTFTPDADLAAQGARVYGLRCITCHGMGAVSGGHGPDLRTSLVPQSQESFDAVVRDGALVERGMPRFEELTADELQALRQYVRTRGHDLTAAH